MASSAEKGQKIVRSCFICGLNRIRPASYYCESHRGGEQHGTTIITVIVAIPQLGTFVEVIDNSGILLKVRISGDDLGDYGPCRLLLPAGLVLGLGAVYSD